MSNPTKQYEISVSSDHIREAISKLSAVLCDLTEQALVDDDLDEVDSEFEQFCQDLRQILTDRPDLFPAPLEDEPYAEPLTE